MRLIALVVILLVVLGLVLIWREGEDRTCVKCDGYGYYDGLGPVCSECKGKGVL